MKSSPHPSRRSGDSLRLKVSPAEEPEAARDLRVWDNFQRMELDAIAERDRLNLPQRNKRVPRATRRLS